MGLFKKKETPAPAAPVQQKPKVHDEYDVVVVNLSEKMLRVELEEGNGYALYGEIKHDGEDRIRIVSRGIIIAEVTKRSKAFGELEPLIGRTLNDVSLEAKTGEYGVYYRTRLRFRYTVVEA